MITALIFIAILSVLVLVHEWGHFVTARKSGMKVHEFGFGFPPRAFGVYKDPGSGKWIWVKGRGTSMLRQTVGGSERKIADEFPATLYSVNWLPLGGFVKIKGENGEETEDCDSFGYHKAWKKLVVLLSGVAMNVLLAAVLLSFGFTVGLPAEASLLQDPRAIVVEESAVLVQQVEDNSPAEAGGLQFGDKILSIDGISIHTATQMIEYVRAHSKENMTLVLERQDQTESIVLKPAELQSGAAPRLGIVLADAGVVRYPWYIALYKGFVAAGIALFNIFIGFYILIKGLILGDGMAFGVAGPVGIAVVVGQSARLGFHYLLNVTAMISLSLAAINVLPIPALDGGRALFVIIQKFIGRPVPMKYEQAAHTIGFILLMILIVAVTYKDVAGLL
ncbi:MAG: site-2 protease family protein [Candidatus Magasanikbacteria bacterium]|nr:site-2 protease family protein [Candidatus Magasanikbacteria bacterium]